MKVDFAELSLIEQVLDRQGGHIHAAQDYVRARCTIDTGDLGFLLSGLEPLFRVAVDTAADVLVRTNGLHTDAAAATAATLAAYVESERATHEAVAAVTALLGASSAPYADPTSGLPSLGPAVSAASSGYGVAAPDALGLLPSSSTAFELASESSAAVSGAMGAAERHADEWRGAGVAERSDASSYLVATHSGEDFVREMRWGAGVVLGSLDWVAEQFLGYSVLEEVVFKPFGGDWHALEESSQAWSHAGRSLREVGVNVTGLPRQAAGWEGDAADRFAEAMVALGVAMTGIAMAFEFVSGLVTRVATVAKLACTGIAAILKAISDKLARMLVEASIPIAGWIVAAAETVLLVNDIIKWIRRAFLLIDLVLGVISDFVKSREQIVQAALLLDDLAAIATRRAVSA